MGDAVDWIKNQARQAGRTPAERLRFAYAAENGIYGSLAGLGLIAGGRGLKAMPGLMAATQRTAYTSRMMGQTRAIDALGLERGANVSESIFKKTKEQPWNVRPGQEWKQKIIGKAQKTGTPGHATTSYKEAMKAAKQEDTASVLLNRGYKKATGQQVKPNRRPDVTVVKTNGKVNVIEVKSKSDKVRELRQRNQEVINMLPEHMRGDVDIMKANKDMP